MQRIGLVQCVSKKLDGEHQAMDLYISPYFAKMKAYVGKHCDKWYILSAEYYLVKPESKIKSYDKTLNKITKYEIKAWAKETARQITLEIPSEGTEIEFHAGKKYKNDLEVLLCANGYKIVEDLRDGMKIGERLSWYSKNI